MNIPQWLRYMFCVQSFVNLQTTLKFQKCDKQELSVTITLFSLNKKRYIYEEQDRASCNRGYKSHLVFSNKKLNLNVIKLSEFLKRTDQKSSAVGVVTFLQISKGGAICVSQICFLNFIKLLLNDKKARSNLFFHEGFTCLNATFSMAQYE